jgi:hypothetical protein
VRPIWTTQTALRTALSRILHRSKPSDWPRRPASGITRECASVHRAAGGDRPDLLDAIAAYTDIPVVKVDGRVAMAGNQPDLVADVETVRRT